MGRPKRQKPYNPLLAEYQRQQSELEDAKKRDRKSRDLLRNAQVAPMEVECPVERNGTMLVVMRSIRNDPLAALHSRGHIREDQYQAGRAFQSDFEAVERPAQAVDPSKPYVDCSRNPQPLSDQFSRSLIRLNRAHGALGMIGSPLAHDVLITGLTYAQIAEARNLRGRSWEEHFGKLFRQCLDCLAIVYGFAMEKR